MDGRIALALCGLIVASSYLSLTLDKSYAFDRPIHTSIAVLAVIGLVLVGWSRVCRFIWRSKPKHAEYSVLPLKELGNELPSPRSPRPRSPLPRSPTSPSSPRFANGNGFPKSPKIKPEPNATPNLKKLRFTWLLLVTAICCRVKLLHWIARESQCAQRGYAWAIPLVVAIHDFWTVRRFEQPHGHEGGRSPSIIAALRSGITQSRYRFLLPTSCLAVGCAMIIAATDAPRSTYICADVFDYRGIVPFSQLLATVFDCIIIISVVALASRGKAIQSQETKSYSSIAWALISSSFVLAVGGILFVVIRPEYRHWAFSLSFYYIRSLCALASVALLFVVCAIHAFDGVGALTTSVIITFVCTFSQDLDSAWTNSWPFPPMNTALVLSSICLYILGTFWYTRIDTSGEDNYSTRTPKQRPASTRLSGWLSVVIIVLFVVRLVPVFSRTTRFTHHPIDDLIETAHSTHQKWLKKASNADSLSDCISQYRIRNHRPPPPEFDVWYEWAESRNCLIMNDYDQIHDDLIPFWGLSPQEIRQRTWDMISNPTNGVGGILIRSGRADVAPNVESQHKGLLEGAVRMINKFARHLPDMDLAINLIDSPRVAVPFSHLESMRKAGIRNEDDRANKGRFFSGDRAGQWPVLPDGPVESPPMFEDYAGHEVFSKWGSASCPTLSPSRLQRNWDLSRLCTSCARPHSDHSGAFVSNWTLAQDPCHQPDLGSLHGLYVSPPSFRPSHHLLPVFSHSKAQGFQDIIYPSVEEYTASGDAVYAPTEEHPDPPFADKEPTLFFRGAASEGITTGNNAWRSFLRQRFLYLLGPGSHSGVTSPILLPAQGSESFRFFKIPDDALRSSLPTDAKFTKIENCMDPDCSLEHAQFESVVEGQAPSAVSLQDHWKYKYLLDLDGVGRNPRFVAFLRSHSLVFKAGILREWWSHRVTAWKHFIPLDVRGHNLFPTLAYFRGFPATKETGELLPHEDAAQRIAEDGKRWAERVLRKEDMEVYMFRLLLEWGRLTDDRRDDLGFGAEEKWWEGTRVGVGQGKGGKKKNAIAKWIGG